MSNAIFSAYITPEIPLSHAIFAVEPDVMLNKSKGCVGVIVGVGVSVFVGVIVGVGVYVVVGVCVWVSVLVCVLVFMFGYQ